MSKQDNQPVEDPQIQAVENSKDSKKNDVSSTEKVNLWKGRIEKNKKRENNEKKYTGVVTSVQSGDSIRILPSDVLYSPNAQPNPIYVKLTGVTAPALEKTSTDKDGQKEYTADKEFAWSSREFLREMLIGQPVIYQIPFIGKGGVHYGNVWIYNQGELVNVIEESIANGWVAVNRRPELEGKDYETAPIIEYKRMILAEEDAKAAGLGIHCKSKAKAQASIRHVHRHDFQKKDNKSAFELFEKIKEIPQHGVVERVKGGTSLRIILLDRMDEITIDLSGVQSPFKDAPYAHEATWFTSHYLLNRDVIVYLELMDSKNRFYATVKLKDDPDFDITIELLQNGLAKLVDWSVSKGAYIAELQAAEESAKEQNLRIWESFKEKKNGNSFKHEFNGRVVEVLNSGTLRVLPKGASDSIYVQMSSMKPLYGRLSKNYDSLTEDQNHIKLEMEKDKAFSFMGKDFTRKLLIGKNVTCIEDYSFRDNKYYSVFLKELNVSLRILEEGWARISNHNEDSDRSPQYQQMVLAYNRASKAGRGVHGSINNAQTSFNDLTNEDSKKTQMFFGFFQRAGRVAAVVEYVFSATTFKIRIPSQNNVLLRFCCEGCYSDRTTKNENNEYPDTPGNRGLAYSRKNLYQKDVDIIIGSIDKHGSFYGKLYNHNKDFTVSLLEEGYAKLKIDTAITMTEFDQYKTAEQKAKDNTKNMWQDFDAEAEAAKKEKRKEQYQKERQASSKQFQLVVTEILDGSHFWYQKTDGAEALQQLMSMVEEENLDALAPFEPKPSDMVFAKFSGDGKYYRTTVTRTRIEEGEKVHSVLFIDYGNVQSTPTENIRKLDVSKYGPKVLSPQALQGSLAFVRTPKLREEYGYEAASFLKELVYEKQTLIATGVSKDKNGVESLNIGDEENQIYVNSVLVAAGLAQVEKLRNRGYNSALHEQLKELESEVKDEHLNMWKHGEPPDSDEEREEQKREKGILL